MAHFNLEHGLAKGRLIRCEVGDTFTIPSMRKANPKWRWWKFWEQKALSELVKFTVVKAD